MDKSAIKKYAVWARNELIERVSQKADQYEISADADPNADSAHGALLTPAEKKQRVSLIDKVKKKGMDQVIEEVAYTWFNRFAALRFMEVNNYLPTRVRVFTNEESAFKPEILTEAIHLDLDGLDMEKVYSLKDANDDEALFKYLIITQCNALSNVLPGMFQKIEDCTELLFPDNLLREGSVIEQMVTTIPEADWKDQVQIIGWLYQYYNTEPKDKVFADLKKNKKIAKEKIPAATQLFTPDWIVRYMVENSLGRLLEEGHPNNDLKSNWKYYLDDAEQDPDVQKQLDDIYKEYSTLKPEDIRAIDPCMGSGHIICYMFDVLMQIYEAYGYTARDAVSSIVQNNLYGLDIDERAAQLAYFAVMMTARKYDRRFFRRGIQPHVYAIQESNELNPDALAYFINGNPKLQEAMDTLISDLHDAKEYGSILNVSMVDFPALYARFDEIKDDVNLWRDAALNQLLPFVQCAQTLAQKYHVVVTNPPYMGSSGMSGKLSEFIKKNYPDSKSDLFAVFIEHCGQMVKKDYYQAMITQHAWMFLSSFEKLRKKMLQKTTVNMAHLGARAFEEIGGEVVQTTSFVMLNRNLKNYKGVYCRLIEPTTQQGKEDLFLSGNSRYESTQSNFSKIPGSPVAYWLNPHWFDAFKSYPIMRDLCVLKKGTSTGDNNRFIKQWQEVNITKVLFDAHNPDEAMESHKKWFPINGGGERRKWYGNRTDLVNWESDGVEMKALATKLNHGGHWSRYIINPDRFFTEAIGWSAISSSKISARYIGYGFAFSSAAMEAFGADIKYILALINSIVAEDILKLLAPTINFGVEQIGKIPLIKRNVSEVEHLTDECIRASKIDWDSFEISWDFKRHPLMRNTHTIKDAFFQWQVESEERFSQLKANEEELNRIFIDIYGLQDELTPEEDEKDVTVRKADLERDIRSFVSYAVGCMFGRYSLDVDGLAYAGGDWDDAKYKTFMPDKDAIIPITDDEYFTDDIVGRFVEFVMTVYGADTLEENLKFIADALDEKGSTSREVIRNYFLKDFYKDHCKTYQKRPIYWLFDSGKKNGFKCLIYMHRYQPDTIARIRTDYVHEQQARYRTAISGLERQINGAPTSERVRLNKLMTKLKDQAEETRLYEEKIHHLADQMIEIDLDDGVKHNYAIFQDVLAKIK